MHLQKFVQLLGCISAGKLFLLSVENDYFNSAKYLMVRTIWLV